MASPTNTATTLVLQQAQATATGATQRSPQSVLRALRELFATLTDAEFFGEYEVERLRRSQQLPSVKRPAAAHAQRQPFKKQKTTNTNTAVVNQAVAVAPVAPTPPVTAVAPVVTVVPEDPQWLAMYNQLVAFKAEHGTVIVPSKTHATLYTWLSKQRSDWKAFCKKNSVHSKIMTPARIQKLVDLGLGTLQNGPYRNMAYQAKWQDMFQKLVAFKNKHGDFNIMAHKGGAALNSWVQLQRKAFANRTAPPPAKGKRNIALTDDRMQRLAAIGFVFAKQVHTFEERLQHMRDYQAEYGDTRVPVAFKGYDNLGRWVSSIKCHYWKGKFPPAQVAKLDAMGFDWKMRSNPLNRPR